MRFYCKVRVVELLLLSENKDMTGEIVSRWAGWPNLGQGAAGRGVGVRLPCEYGYSGCWPSGEQAGVERVTPAHQVFQAPCSKVPQESSAIPS